MNASFSSLASFFRGGGAQAEQGNEAVLQANWMPGTEKTD